jgi:tight adherence protein B
MRARVVRRAAAAAAVAAVALLPGAAHADGGRITSIDANGSQLRLVFSAGTLPEGATLDPATVKLTVDGRPLKPDATALAGSTVPRSAVLVIDTSQSMAGEGIAGAKAAGLAFVDAVPAEVRVGVVSFSSTPTVRVAPTTDRGALRTAINALRVEGSTALYDGVLVGVEQLGKTGVRSVVILSDGADSTSRAKLPQVTAAVRAARVTASAVAFRTRGATVDVLQQIAAAGGGSSVSAAGAADIGRAFRDSARAIANQLTVTATLPPGLSGSVEVAVSVQAGAVTLSDKVARSVDVPLATAPGDAADDTVEPGALGSKAALWGGVLALFVALAAVLALFSGGLAAPGESGRMRRRLSLYTLTGRAAAPAPEATALGDSGVAHSAVELADRLVRQRDFEASVAKQLERAGSNLKPAEWLIVHSLATLGGAFLMLLLFGGRIGPTLLGFVLGFVGPYVFLKIKATRRTNSFLSQMPDTLQLIAGSLQAGYSLPQAIDAVVREGAQPVSGEFNRAIIESRLGVPIEDALDNVAGRMVSRDFAWVVMAIRIQREVGGNLAEVLTTVSSTMRERERVRRQVRVLSAEGRLSAWILGGLPPVFAMYLLLVRPGYIHPLFHDSIGILLLSLAGALFSVGVFWLSRVVRVEV